MDAPLIGFRLTDLRSIDAWEGRLHWFGLTDGAYWLRCDEVELFRYAGGRHTYVDYYVVRLWEDLLELLPRILHEIPPDVASALTPTSITAASEDDGPLGRLWSARLLDCGYLVNPPLIWIFSTGGRTHIRWHIREPADPSAPRWIAKSGGYDLPTGDFVNEVRDFDRRLFETMNDRVAAVLRGELGPMVKIDLRQLETEQQARANWLERALTSDPAAQDREAEVPSWQEMRAALR
jgi:hypothetical protein